MTIKEAREVLHLKEGDTVTMDGLAEVKRIIEHELARANVIERPMKEKELLAVSVLERG